MEKPIELKVSEFNDGIVNLINNSGLPLWYIAEKLRNVLNEVVIVSEREKADAMMRFTKEESEVNDDN